MPSISDRATALKKRIHSGETIVGVSASPDSDGDTLRSIVEADSYDFLWVDSQHDAYNETNLIRFCTVAAELDMPVHFRIKHTRHTYLIGNVLDLGPAGIEVPQVETVDTVREAGGQLLLRSAGSPQLGRLSPAELGSRDRSSGVPALVGGNGSPLDADRVGGGGDCGPATGSAGRRLPLLRTHGPDLQPGEPPPPPVQERRRLCPAHLRAASRIRDQGLLPKLHARYPPEIPGYGGHRPCWRGLRYRSRRQPGPKRQVRMSLRRRPRPPIHPGVRICTTRPGRRRCSHPPAYWP